MALFDTQARRLVRYLPRTVMHRTAGTRLQPELVRFDVQDGLVPSSKPPVRIFLGTEPVHYRAERVFMWSIYTHRDPTRVYEIYLMKDLAGFDRRGWLTGFTNYRFAIPHFTGGVGRAIYNDVDQIYLGDPGALFDAELAGHGFLALSDRDTSVMLIDCARMSSVWTLDEARRNQRKVIEAKTRAIPGLCGQLDPMWHARDAEYVPHHSQLLHYTAMHRQPWQPLRRRYAYQRHPFGQVWLDVERAADTSGYQVFSATCPSAQYQALLPALRPTHAHAGTEHRRARSKPSGTSLALRELITAADARTILVYGFGMADDTREELAKSLSGYPRVTITCYDRACPSLMEKPLQQYDGVVCSQGLEYLPDEDVPWVLDDIFAHATRVVYLMLTQTAHPQVAPQSTRALFRQRDIAWWQARVAAAGARHPAIHWRLVVQRRNSFGQRVMQEREGGRRLQGPPTVWVLTDAHPGNTTQSVGLLRALGWPYEFKELHFTSRVRLHKKLFGIGGATLLGLDRERAVALTPPWPDLVVTTGLRSAHVARWIRQQSRGCTRLVQLGRAGGQVGDWYDAVVSCTYFRLPPHPRRVESVTPLTQITPERLAQAAERWGALFEGTPRPRIALLVGGSSNVYRLDAGIAQRLGEDVRTFAQEKGGSVFATTSLRTKPHATEALRRALGEECFLHQWQPDQPDNPYLGYLAMADVLVVTGDSESMLAEAVATGKPVYIYPLPVKPLTRRQRRREWVVARAQQPRMNTRGTDRPQQGVSYLCARLIERGIVLPPNDPNMLHHTLVQHGLACFFGEPMDLESRPPLRELDDVAHRVKTLIGMR